MEDLQAQPLMPFDINYGIYLYVRLKMILSENYSINHDFFASILDCEEPPCKPFIYTFYLIFFSAEYSLVVSIKFRRSFRVKILRGWSDLLTTSSKM
jgi:hypothetical protein